MIHKIKSYIKIWVFISMIGISIHAVDFDTDIGGIRLYINDQLMQTNGMDPIKIEGRIMVPAREVFENMGAQVYWKPEERRVYIQQEEMLIVLQLDNTEVDINGKTFILEVPATTINGKIMLPLRFISEQIGYQVKWEELEQSVYIYKTDQEVLEDRGEPVQIDKNMSSYRGNVVTYHNNGHGIIVIRKLNTIKKEDITIEDHYRERQLVIKFNHSAKQLIGYGQIQVNDEKVQYIDVQTEGTTKLMVQEASVQAVEVKEDNENIYIELMHPKEKYNQIIFIDPGHGGRTPGTICNGLQEKDVVLKQAFALKTKLEGCGDKKIYMSREDDTLHYDEIAEELEYRTTLANEIGADMFISIHNNSADVPASGTETYYYAANNEGKLLAEKIQKNIVSYCKTRNRGAKPDTGYIVIKKSNMPAVLIEVGFLSNKSEAQKMVTNEFCDQFARAVADAIQDTFMVVSSNS